MDSSNKQPERGSAKLFGLATHDHEGLARALGIARTDYEVKWWWKYGQPQIDLIRAVLEVRRDKLGGTISNLMNMNGHELQVSANCFPYGIPPVEVFRVEVDIRKGG